MVRYALFGRYDGCLLFRFTRAAGGKEKGGEEEEEREKERRDGVLPLKIKVNNMNVMNIIPKVTGNCLGRSLSSPFLSPLPPPPLYLLL